MKILITGGTGALGRRFLFRTLATWVDPLKMIAVARNEARMVETVARFGHDKRFRGWCADVRDLDAMRRVTRDVDVIVHAAAMKRVDTAAHQVEEIVSTNVDGTRNVIRAAEENGVKTVVLVSSDKACEPINAYGASKALAEHIVVSANAFLYPRGQRTCAVRYGNVLGSTGSVVPHWRAQIAQEKPLTLIEGGHMTRFWMTLDAAVELIWRAFTRVKGGEIRVPQIGASSVRELAAAIGRWDGDFRSAPMRGAEKLHEQLISPSEWARTFYDDDGERTCDRIIAPVGYDALEIWDRAIQWGRPVEQHVQGIRSDDGLNRMSYVNLRALVALADQQEERAA